MTGPKGQATRKTDEAACAEHHHTDVLHVHVWNLDYPH
jgi:hypothetical protein